MYRDIWQHLQTFSVFTQGGGWGMPLAFSEQRLGLLLNTLQCTGQP